MGKKNKPNRTKNNARPSSSARSAELLENQAPTFFGLASMKGGAVSMLPGIPTVTDEIDGSIDVNYQIVLKKMVKKDPTTKVKALKEFTEMCDQAKSEEVKTILPFWPRLYSQLCSDTEHRVREAAHQAHKAVVSKVKKSLAPYLKEIIGPWFTSQYDNYPPAATAAAAAFQEAFSPAKMIEAVAFCQDEILDYIVQNLIVHTPQTLSNPKTTSPEDMESKYQRVVTSSLLGYTLYLEKMSPEQLSNKVDSNKRLLVSAKFWKYANSKDPLVRHSFFTALNALFLRGSVLLAGETVRASSAILNNLGENDPLVLPVVWNAVLHGLVALPECWAHPNVEKQLIPKLFNILRSGGDGHACAIFPNILPLLSQIPANVIGDKHEFYGRLFNSMKSGLEAPSVNRSQSESRVVAETFIECLKYITMLELKDSDLVSKIIKNDLIGAIRSRLSLVAVTTPLLTTKPFCFHLSQLLRSWHRSGVDYSLVVNTFWEELGELLETLLNNISCQNDAESILKSQADFLAVLQTPAKYLPSGRERVKFSEKTAEAVAVKMYPVEISAPGFDEACLKCAKGLAASYFRKFKTLGTVFYLKSALELARTFDSFSILGELIGDISLLEKDVPREMVVELNTHILPHVSEKEQERLLKELSVVSDDTLFSLCCGVLRCPTSTVRTWMQGPEFTSMYFRLLQLFLEGQCELRTGDVLKQFIEAEVLLNTAAMRKVMETLSLAVNNEGNENPERVMHIAAAWPGAFSSSREFEEFLISLYLASCRTDNDIYHLLLRQMLQKVKYYRAVEPTAWSSLFKAMASHETKSSDVNRHVSVIAKMLEVATDIDLTEACDSEEIEEVLPLLTIFMEPSKSVLKSKNLVLEAFHLVQEFEGMADATYWRLKFRSGTEYYPSEDREDPLHHEDSMIGCGSSRNMTDLSIPVSEAVDGYLKWLHFAGSLIKLTVKAYPRYARIEALKPDGKHCIVNTEEDLCPNINVVNGNDSGIDPEKIAHEEFKGMQEEEKMLSALYDADDYPDINLLKPIDGLVLSVLGGYAVLLQLSASMAFPEVMGANTDHVQQIVSEIVGNSTPMEFEFLREKIQSITIRKPLWYKSKHIFSRLFHHRFEVNVDSDAEAEINGYLSEAWASSPQLVLRVAAFVKDHSNVMTVEHWRNIFIESDRALKDVLNDVNIKENHVILTGAFSTLYNNLDFVFKIEEGSKVPDDEIKEMWNTIVDSSFSAQLLCFWQRLGAAAGNDETICFTNPHLFVPLTVTSSAVLRAIRNGQARPDDSDSLIKTCASLLLSTFRPLQITAFQFFKIHLTRQVAVFDTKIFQTSSTETDDEDKFSHVRDCPWNLKLLQPALVSAQTVVEAILSEFKMGDTCAIQPNTDSFTYAHGYLLLWCILAEACSEAHAALRYQYAQWLKKDGHLNAFLTAVFKLMPAHVVHGEDNRQPSQFFDTDKDEDLKLSPKSSWVEERACFAYRMILQRLPAAVREWCGELDHYVSNIVTRVTKIHVSPLLVTWELKEVQNIGTDLENLSVSTSVPTREVFATYKVDEAVMQIVITLPANYPLSTVKVDLNAGAGVARGSRILLFLVHRNGSLRDALALWKSDLDKKYEGLEECEICFSILQGPNMEIPKQACKTCRKKFHSVCLYKWFSTSNKSSCPHCRNLY